MRYVGIGKAGSLRGGPIMTNRATDTDRLLYLAEVVCDENASEGDCVELNSILLADEGLRRRFMDYCQLHFTLGLEMQTQWAVQRVHEQIDLEPELPITDPCNLAMPIVLPAAIEASADSHHFVPAISTLFGYTSSGWPVAYLVATVAMAIGLTIAAGDTCVTTAAV